MNRTDGGPAFPSKSIVMPDGNYPDGMSLRDYFAGQALVGLLAENAYSSRSSRRSAYDTANDAYRFADAMLAARTQDFSC